MSKYTLTNDTIIEMVRTVHNRCSMPNILPKAGEHGFQNQNESTKESFRIRKWHYTSATAAAKEKQIKPQNHYRNAKSCGNGSPNDLKWDYFAVLINFFLGIFLPTFDVCTDLLFIIGTWQTLNSESPDILFLSKEEAGKIKTAFAISNYQI